MTSIPLAYWLGIALIFWFLFDLIRGEAYIWQLYSRDVEPKMYWFTMLIWLLIAMSCFVYPNLTS